MKKLLLLSFVVSTSALAESQPLSFDDALAKLIGQSTSLKEADVSVAAAKYQQDHAGYVYAPDFKAFGSVKRGGSDEAGARDSETRSVGVGADWNLYRFGADTAHVEQAAANYGAASYGREAAAKAAEAEAASALFDLIEAEQTRRIVEGILAIQKDNVNVIRKLYERGARPAQDTEKVEIDAANAAARLTDAEISVERARAAIVALSGESLDVKADWPWRERLLQDHANVAAALQGVDLSKRPERLALAEKVKALESGLTVAKAKVMPSLDLSVDYGLGKAVAPEASAVRRQWTGELTLSVPLFDGFVARSAFEEQAKLKQLAELDLAVKERELKSELDEVQAGFAAALKSAKAREVALKSAKTLYEHSLKGFRSGVLSANDLILDQGRVYDTELNALKGWSTVHRYLARLCRVAGRALTECVGS